MVNILLYQRVQGLVQIADDRNLNWSKQRL